MLLAKGLFAQVYLLASGLVLVASALVGRGPGFPRIDPGSDTPADPATTGYFLNHFSLNVQNLTHSTAWYNQVLGLRLIFIFRATEKFSIAYMAHSHGGRNGTGYQTVREINRQKNNMEGLLELVHYSDPTEPLVPSTVHANTFGHFGVIVPDIPAAQARFEKLGVNFIKKAGEAAKLEGPIAESYGLGGVYERDPKEAEELYQAVLAPGLMDFALVTDPDGNLIEVQSLYTPQLEF